MRSMTSKILGRLNESVVNPAPNGKVNEGVDDASIQNEPTTGVDTPKKVYQCDNCAEFYVGSGATNESVDCPFCGNTGHEVGVVNEIDNEDEPKEPLLTEEEESELRSEAEVIVKEALSTLDKNNLKKFNESYRPRVRVTSKGELEALVESSKGAFVTAKRRMTSRQKAAYSLSENYKPVASTPAVSNKKLENIRMSRQSLMMKNESRAVKIQACKILERQGVKYDFKKFNESMDQYINSRNFRSMVESICEDDEIGKSEFDQMTPDQIGDQVATVVKDTGLGVIANDVQIDGDTATVNLRLEDSDNVEVHTTEVEEVLKDVFDTPVEIVGPYQSEGDKSVSDIAVVINPESEGDPEEDPKSEGDMNEGTEDPLAQSELDGNKIPVNEKFVQGTGNVSLFALLSNDSADNEPQFLAQDDSMVSGNEDNAEDLARVFVSEDAARKYLQSAGIEDKFTPVSISVVTNESLEDPDYSSGMSMDEDGEIETDDGTYFKQDGYCYKRTSDGKIEECDESEFNAAKASKYDTSGLKESYKNRRKSSRK